MPIVVKYDSPALVAQLAGGAGQFATNEHQQLQAMRMAADYRAAQQQSDYRQMQSQQMDLLRQQSVQQQYQADAGSLAALNQQNQLQYLQQSGQLSMQPPAQQPLPQGVNPQTGRAGLDLFQPTYAGSSLEGRPFEQQRALAGQQFNDQQQAMGNPQYLPPGDPRALTPPAQQQQRIDPQLRLAEQDAFRRQKTEYDLRRQNLLDRIGVLQKQLAGHLSTVERNRLNERMGALEKELEGLPEQFWQQQEQPGEAEVPEMTAEQAVIQYGSAAAAEDAYNRGEFRLKEER